MSLPSISSVLFPVLFWGALWFLPFSRAVKFWIVGFTLALAFLGYASAQALPAPVFPASVSGNVTTFSGAVTTAANASSLTFGHAANGPVYADTLVSVRTASGKVVPVVARSTPSALEVGKAVGRFAGKVVGVLAVGVALYDLAKELGFTLDNSSGSVVVSRDGALVDAYCDQTGRGSVCQSYVAGNLYGPGARCIPAYRAGMCFIDLTSPSYGLVSNTEFWSPRSTPIFSPVPSTPSEFESIVASRTSWPSTSRINDVLDDAVKAGVPLPLPAPNQITGPASVPGDPRTVTKPDGSRTVTTTADKLSYGPGTVTATQETTSQDFDALGSPTGGVTTTTESPPAPKPDPITCGLPGTPACKIDEVGTPTNPITAAQTSLQTVKDSQASFLEKAAGVSDKNWQWTFIGAPPIAACEAVQFPGVSSLNIAPPPPMDPCGTVDGIRLVMAWIWAFTGFYVCIGLVREVI